MPAMERSWYEDKEPNSKNDAKDPLEEKSNAHKKIKPLEEPNHRSTKKINRKLIIVISMLSTLVIFSLSGFYLEHQVPKSVNLAKEVENLEGSPFQNDMSLSSFADPLGAYINQYSANATSAYFNQNSFILTHTPLVCAAKPDKSELTDSNLDFVSETNQAIIDWSAKLNAGIEKNPVWKINFKSFEPDDEIEYHPECDIYIRFLSQETSLDYFFVGMQSGGATYYDFSTGKAFIKILYDDMNVYQFDGLIRHELGHAFGLGHYITSQNEAERIVKGLEDSPSIMFGMAANDNYYSITPFDVEEIKKKYGQNGFVGKNVDNNDKSDILPELIHADEPKGIGYYGTDSVLVKDLVVTGYLKIPESTDRTKLTYELPLDIRDGLVSPWAAGKMTDAQFIEKLQNLVDSGTIDLTMDYAYYSHIRGSR